LCAAWALADDDVTVVDRGGFGQAASKGNAGWVTSSLAGPLPAPGIVWQGLRWMLRPDSPLLIRPRRDRDFTRWLWHFARNCREDTHAAGTRTVLALSRASQQAYADLAADEVRFEAHRTGLIMAARTEAGLGECHHVRDGLVAQGYEGALTMLSSAETRALEPSFDDSVLGALYVEDDWHVDPESLCAGLVERLRRRGTRLVSGVTVRRLTRGGGAWTASVDGRPPIRADQVVVAGGAWSKLLLRDAGVEILLEAAKGYSVTGAVDNGPGHAVYMVETKVGCSPFSRTTRLAGTLELGGLDETIRPRRLGGVMRSGPQYFRSWDMRGAHAWAGLRPATPDGLPYIGAASAQPELFVATGHNMLGVTLAPGSGVALAGVMDGGRPSDVLWPFRLDRPMS
jgi:D-amino-acid dehydrogenase